VSADLFRKGICLQTGLARRGDRDYIPSGNAPFSLWSLRHVRPDQHIPRRSENDARFLSGCASPQALRPEPFATMANGGSLALYDDDDLIAYVWGGDGTADAERDQPDGLTDSEFINRCLWRVADGGGEVLIGGTIVTTTLCAHAQTTQASRWDCGNSQSIGMCLRGNINVCGGALVSWVVSICQEYGYRTDISYGLAGVRDGEFDAALSNLSGKAKEDADLYYQTRDKIPEASITATIFGRTITRTTSQWKAKADEICAARDRIHNEIMQGQLQNRPYNAAQYSKQETLGSICDFELGALQDAKDQDTK
jgi:hypothetical protein